MDQLLQVTTTTGDRSVAERIATEMVDRRLAACAQVFGPLYSTYRWQGRVERAEEYVCVLKTRLGLFSEVEQTVRQLHPYDVPELIGTPVTVASRAYGQWVIDSVVAEPADGPGGAE